MCVVSIQIRNIPKVSVTMLACPWPHELEYINKMKYLAAGLVM